MKQVVNEIKATIMRNNNPIETWTRKQCEEYLRQYPKSLKSEAVRKRLEALTPEIDLTKSEENAGKKNNKHKKEWTNVAPKQSFAPTSSNSVQWTSSTSKPSQNQRKYYGKREPVSQYSALQTFSKSHQVNAKPETERESRMKALKAARESRLNTRRFLRTGGIIICIIAAIAIVVAAINTGTEITITIVLALLYPIYKLSTWDIEKNL